MAVKFRILLLFIGIATDSLLAHPTILSPDKPEYTLSPGENYTLICKSRTEITWTYPEDPNISILVREEDDLFTSELRITDANVSNVGWYFCNETDIPENYASTYIYVDDNEVLFVGDSDIMVVKGKQFSPLIIPCRPTSPTVDVKLYSGLGTNDEDEVPWKRTPLGLNQDGTIWEFDPKIGFSWLTPREQVSSIYDCRFRNHFKDFKFTPQKQNDEHWTYNRTEGYKVYAVEELLVQRTCKFEKSGAKTIGEKSFVVIVTNSAEDGNLVAETHIRSSSLIEVLPLSATNSYDPKVGFEITWSEKANIVSSLTCILTKGNESIDILVLVHMSKMYDRINEPVLHQLNDTAYNVEGENLVLKCEVEPQPGQEILFKWELNGTKIKEKKDKYSNESGGNNFSILTVHNLTLDGDQGNYTCHVTDTDNNAHTSLMVSILKKGEKFLYLSESNNITTATCLVPCGDIVFNINVTSYPPAKISWYNDDKRRIRNDSSKYSIKNTKKESIIIIRNTTIRDGGTYTISATNGVKTENLTVMVEVSDKPSVRILKDDFHLPETSEIVRCEVAGNPHPKIEWEFKHCIDNSCDFETLKSDEYLNRRVYISTAKVNAKQSGYLKCKASNEYGTDEQIVDYTVTDVKNGFQVIILEDDVEISASDSSNVKLAVGDRVTFECLAAAQNYSTEIKWYLNNTLLTEIGEFTPHYSSTMYSTNRSFSLDSIKADDGGIYKCETERKSKEGVKSQEILVDIIDAYPPKIVLTNMNKTDTVLIFPASHNFSCKSEGVPKPSVRWFKDYVELFPDNDRIKFRDSNQVLLFTSTQSKDEGHYSCEVENRIGFASKSTMVTFKNKVPQSYTMYYILAVIIIILFVLLAILFAKVMKQRKLKKMLRLAGLANFEKGAVECINPDLGIDDQAELLPYDKESWEIPREHIKLGKQLGAGAFGVVMKALLEQYVDNETSLTVAVKMVKKNADDSYLRALVSELKIMVHLGKHLNVVNLIGACTKHVTKRELYVVVEYCRFGNLHNYLLRHRENFINQMDPVTGKIDYSIGMEILSRSFSVSSSHSQEGPPKDMMDYRSNSNGVMQTTDVTLVSMSPSGSQGDEPLMSNSSTQPEWRSNYKGDYKGNVKPICTKDLLTWAFQVSRGMEYLASRKVLHGDLAARNILLADNNIVKICDFGLAKNMYKGTNYKKKSDGPLPIKWMSIESIRDKVFSTQSDVWSFGIVLWEFFSLARTPYPGMEADERLYQKLLDGYRMDPPIYATKEVYTMMSNCWEPKPQDRPTFGKLTERIGNMLEESVKRHYIDLNDPYLKMNTEKFQIQNDYLQMVSPPDFEKLSSPHYVNDLPPTPATAQSDYMPMKPGLIFSPRERDGEVFTFSDLNNKDGHTPELAPMLKNDSDYETQPNSPKSPQLPSYANPTYNKIDFLNEKNIIVNTPDNYVNMPKNKSAIKGDNDKFIKDESHYVNDVSRDWERVQ